MDCQNFSFCGNRMCLSGMCPLRSGEKSHFQSQFTCFGAFFLFEVPPHKVRCPIVAKKLEGAYTTCAPLLNLPLVKFMQSSIQNVKKLIEVQHLCGCVRVFRTHTNSNKFTRLMENAREATPVTLK